MSTTLTIEQQDLWRRLIEEHDQRARQELIPTSNARPTDETVNTTGMVQAVAVPLSDTLRRAYFVEGLELSPLATAYARARGADAKVDIVFVNLLDIVRLPGGARGELAVGLGDGLFLLFAVLAVEDVYHIGFFQRARPPHYH